MQALQPERQHEDEIQQERLEKLRKDYPYIAYNILLGLVRQPKQASRIAMHDLGILEELKKRKEKTSSSKKEPDVFRASQD